MSEHESSKRFALVGDPIAHSPSPHMHNAAFQSRSIAAHYSLRPTPEADAAEVLNELKNGHWDGLNVTTPLKETFTPFVELDENAKRALAVNTITVRDGQLKGALTDVEGVRRPLESREADGDAALVIGAGGAARAAALALADMGFRVHVAARRREPAEELLGRLDSAAAGDVYSLSGAGALRPVFASVGVVVQATPAGKAGERHPLPWEDAHAGIIAFEMLYRPLQTPFLEDAKRSGARLVQGWEMLLHQGAASWALWTEQQAPLDIMQKALLEALQN